MNENIIQAKDITKKFGSNVVLTNANMTIKQGQSIALVGHNGSGKSTFLKIISGLTSIDAGKISCSKDLKFSYIPERFPKLNITPKKYIKHFGEIEGLRKNETEYKSKELFKAFFLDDMLDIPMKYLSKGTLQKVGVVQAFLTTPDVLLLDEPLSGQDQKSQRVFISMTKEMNKSGTTIVMSCHEPFLIESLSSNIYEIRNKKFIARKIHEIYEEKYDILVFINTMHKKVVNEEILKLTKEIEYENDVIKLKVTSDSSNKLLLKALEEGYVLRRMYSE